MAIYDWTKSLILSSKIPFSEEELKELVKEVSLRDFKRVFVHEVSWNRRLRTTGGRFIVKSLRLEFNPKVFAAFSREVGLGIIRHELCHYHLYLQKKPYQHRSSDFRRLLQEVGGLRYTPALKEEVPYIYECQRCGQIYPRQRRINIKKYRCGHCQGPLHCKKNTRNSYSIS